jgi:hypothetical protein
MATGPKVSRAASPQTSVLNHTELCTLKVTIQPLRQRFNVLGGQFQVPSRDIESAEKKHTGDTHQSGQVVVV